MKLSNHFTLYVFNKGKIERMFMRDYLYFVNNCTALHCTVVAYVAYEYLHGIAGMDCPYR